MKKKVWLISGILVLASILVLAGWWWQPEPPVEVVVEPVEVYRILWGATSARSGLFANTVSKAGVINRTWPGVIKVTVVETGGFLENIVRLRGGTIHVGASSTGAAAASYGGAMDWAGDPHQELRSLWGGYVAPIHLLASKASGITTVEGLVGSRFAMNPGTTSGWHIHNFFGAIDLDVPATYQLMGMGASVDGMEAGRIDTWFKAGFYDAMILDIEATMDIKIIPVPEELIERANEVQPGLHRWGVLPEGHFRGVKADQGSYFYVVGDFILNDVPEDIVYKMVKAVYEERAAIVKPLSSLRLGKWDRMFENLIDYDMVVPLHAGAVRFFQGRGYDIPNHLIPPEWM